MKPICRFYRMLLSFVRQELFCKPENALRGLGQVI